MLKITVSDNGGRSADRYTVQIGNAIYGMSEDADQPNGFCQYAGEYPQYCHQHGDKRIKDILSLPRGTRRAIVSRVADTLDTSVGNI